MQFLPRVTSIMGSYVKNNKDKTTITVIFG